jgi:putative FmdB family regulatory protein
MAGLYGRRRLPSASSPNNSTTTERANHSMPTYEYKCEACGHAFEKFQSIMSKPIRKCPKCGKSRVKRLIGTGSGVIFKGGGFYTTDYRSDAYKDSAKNDTGGKPETKSETPAKSDGATPAGAPSKSDTSPAKSESKPADKPKESKAAEPAKPTAQSSAKSSGKSKSQSDS